MHRDPEPPMPPLVNWRWVIAESRRADPERYGTLAETAIDTWRDFTRARATEMRKRTIEGRAA